MRGVGGRFEKAHSRSRPSNVPLCCFTPPCPAPVPVRTSARTRSHDVFLTLVFIGDPGAMAVSSRGQASIRECMLFAASASVVQIVECVDPAAGAGVPYQITVGGSNTAHHADEYHAFPQMTPESYNNSKVQHSELGPADRTRTRGSTHRGSRAHGHGRAH